MASGNAIDLMSSVQAPKKPFMTKPAMMHLISEMPDPAAYGANVLTRIAATNASKTYLYLSSCLFQLRFESKLTAKKK